MQSHNKSSLPDDDSAGDLVRPLGRYNEACIGAAYLHLTSHGTSFPRLLVKLRPDALAGPIALQGFR